MNKERRIEQLEFEIAERGTDILELRNQLAEARAEIERLALLAQNQQIVIDAQSRSIQAKDALIEQMRDALEKWVSCPKVPLKDAISASKAALEAWRLNSGIEITSATTMIYTPI